jgi:hypothetical protein
MNLPKFDLGEVLAKKDGLKDSGMDRTHTGGVTRDSNGDAIYKGFDVFTPEHHRIMKIYNEAAACSNKAADGGSDNNDWAAGMVRLLPEYYLSVDLLSSNRPATAKTFAWNITEGKYFDESSSAGVAANPTQLSKGMENKPTI